MVGRLFGTDGVRGIAGTDLTADLALGLGRAGAAVLARRTGRRPRMLVGRDTRRSGDLLEAALGAGAMSVGADVLRLGVASTPAVAHLVRVLDVDAGAVISASHNPAEYNGIKFFSHDGFKLADALEDEIEALVAAGPRGQGLTGAQLGFAEERAHELTRYVDFIAEQAGDLTGLRIACDCANGAASVAAPAALRQAGAAVEVLYASPDGLNINDGCGSLHPEELARRVRSEHLSAGFAFDGDADRCIAVDEQGRLVDGDAILAMLALDLHEAGALPGDAVVGTVMSNLGLELCLRAHGCRLLRAPVGDRYVLEEMRAGGLALGGEPSGHVILLGRHTTGDGLLTAARVAALMWRTGRPLSELASVVRRLPQVLRNIRVGERDGLETNGTIAAAITAAQDALGSRGRILVRRSGTEPLVRVMAEGEDEQGVQRAVDAICAVVAAELGAG